MSNYFDILFLALNCFLEVARLVTDSIRAEIRRTRTMTNGDVIDPRD